MTAAGVQTIDFAAYVAPPPSTSSPDAAGTAAGEKQGIDAKTADSQGGPSDFQTELKLLQTGAQETPPAGTSKTGSKKTDLGKTDFGKTDFGKTGHGKTGSGKSSKTDNAQLEDPNVPALMPAQVTEPQKQVLPLVLALPKPEDNAPPDQKASGDEFAGQGENLQPAQQPGQATARPIVTESRQPAEPKPLAKPRDFAKVMELPLEKTPAVKLAPRATTDSAPDPLPPVAANLLPARETPGQHETTKSKESSPTSVNPIAPPETRPVSRDDVKMPAPPPEPVSTAAPETQDSAPANSSPLAFAARLTTPSQNADHSVAANAAPVPASADAQTLSQIPVRYAPTAQILASVPSGTKVAGSKLPGTKEDEAKKADEPKKDDEPKNDEGILFDRSLRTGPRSEVRTDMAPPRFETSSETASNPGPASPPQPAASARLERILETPEVKPAVAAPASGHDIRVRVPDNNGGSTQVRFVESRGEVRVSVRTADEGLAQNLRSHLNDLTQKLSDGGMPAEIWKPASSAAFSQNDQHQPERDGRGSGGQGSGNQGEQQDRQQKRPAWLEQMEASLHGNQD